MCTYDEHTTTCKTDFLCSHIHCLREKQAAKALPRGSLLNFFKQGEYSSDTYCFVAIALSDHLHSFDLGPVPEIKV